MSSTTANTLSTFIKNIDNIIVKVDLEDRFADLTLHIYNPEDNSLTELAHPNFDFIGDVNGPIMPHVNTVTGGYDVGPRWPTIKVMFKEGTEYYNMMVKYNRLIHVGYYAAILTEYIKNNLKWKEGDEFHGFLIKGVDTKDNLIELIPIFKSGPVEVLTENIIFTTKITAEMFMTALRKGFGLDRKFAFETPLTIPMEHSIVYESAKGKGKGNKSIYLNCKLSHKSFPASSSNKYRAVNEKSSDDMLKASNWGINIPILISAVQGGEKRYFAPSKSINWVDHPELGFKEVVNTKDSNFFWGKVIFNGKKTTHFVVPRDMKDPILLKYNCGWIANVFKLPEASTIGSSTGVSSGFEEMDLDEDKILTMHKSGGAPLKSADANSFDEGVSNQPKTSPTKSKALKSKVADNTESKGLKLKDKTKTNLSDNDE